MAMEHEDPCKDEYNELLKKMKEKASSDNNS